MPATLLLSFATIYMVFGNKNPRFGTSEKGQSLVETALMIPLFLLVVFNALRLLAYRTPAASQRGHCTMPGARRRSPGDGGLA